MFVLLAGLGQPGFVEITVLVMYEFHAPVHGIPVGVHVERAHEDTDHQSLIVEILIFLHFLDDHDAAVGRSHDDILCIPSIVADRTAVEVDDCAINDTKEYYEYPKGNLCIKKIP
jgi:hypothetical protein